MPRDPDHWLYRLTPREWIRAGLEELSRARAALARNDRRAAMVGCRRAAGMALNGALAIQHPPDERYGRSYMDHLRALTTDDNAPDEVREAARLLVQTPLPGSEIVALRTATLDQRQLEAARTVMAHALALVLRSEPEPETHDEEPESRD